MVRSRAKRKSLPALPDLFMWTEGGVRLMSNKCGSCGAYFFPKYHEQHRPGCSRQGIESTLLSKGGRLASHTIQHYMPPPPFRANETIVPYAVGLVEFPEGIQVAGIVVDCQPDQLKIGMTMETTTMVLYTDDEGQSVVTWAFRPSSGH
jgi:uncharacterized OB-fold protein